MRRSLLLLALVVALAPLATAAPAGLVTFRTYPEGAQVILEVSGQGSSYLGKSGRPLLLVRASFQDPNASASDGTHPWLAQRVTFKLAGHVDKLVTVDNPRLMFEKGEWPADGSAIALTPDNWRVSAADFLYAYRLPVGVALVLALAAARRGATARRALARARLIESYRRGADDEWIGSVVGRWRLIRRLGSGGMAAVYEAVPDDTLESADAVAVKLIHAELARDAEFSDRFRREIQMSQKLDHPNVVRVMDWGVDNPMYLSMELVRGKPLRDLMPAGGMEVSRAVDIMAQILEALQHAHGLGIVHRDLKPDNVMVTDEGRVKLMDFGLARTHDVDSRLTRTGTALGTPAYMSPEQIAGEVAASSDQYALGVMGWEMLVGAHPFGDGESMTMLLQHMTDEIPPVRSRRIEVPEALDQMISRMCAKAAEARFSSEVEALEALRAAR